MHFPNLGSYVPDAQPNNVKALRA